MTQKINWVVTSGKAEVREKSIKYIPEIKKDQLGEDRIQAAIIGSNIDFENGEISMTFKTKDKYTQCQVILNNDHGSPLVVVGLNTNGFLYGAIRFNNSKVENLNVSGSPDNFDLKKSHQLKLKVNGSIIELFIDDVLVVTAFEIIKKSQVKLYLASAEEFEVTDISIHPQTPKAFVVMQFSDDYNQLYTEVIKPVTESFGLECIRADEYHTTNPIIQDIVNSIREASVIIADITPNNPNVFYEVGYSHAVGKPTILLCDKKREKLPFDISSFRTLFYDNTIAGKTQVEKRLKKFLENIF